MDEARPGMAIAADPKLDWPHDTSYWNNCSQCGVRFMGPKRAPACWKCVADSTKSWWSSKFNKPKLK